MRARTTRSPGPWAWVAGLLGIAVLAIIGFLLFRLLTGGGAGATAQSPSASPEPVTVPSYVDMLIDDAQTEAGDIGLEIIVSGTEESTDVDPGTILSQDPVAGHDRARRDRRSA